MQSWILDESPGAYRWGTIDEPPVGPGDVLVRVVASALNHMDLWVTRGAPKPPQSFPSSPLWCSRKS